MLRSFIKFCLVLASASSFAASQLPSKAILHSDQLLNDIRIADEQKKLVNPRTGILQLTFRWPTGLDGFVNVPIRFRPKDKFCEYSKQLNIMQL